MKIRRGHIGVAGLTLFAAIVTLTVWRTTDLQSPDFDASQVSDAAASASLPPVDADPSAVPAIEVETDHLDLGVVPHDRLTTRPLRIYNRGKTPLKIKDVRTTCACTQGRIAPNRVQIDPGGESIIQVTFDPNRVPGFHSIKTLSIESNDPVHLSTDVKVEARIDPEFVMLPDTLDFAEVPKGEAREAEVVIRQLEDTPLEISEVVEYGLKSPEYGDLSLSLAKRPENEWSVPGKAEYRILVRLSPFMSPGPFQRRLDMSTNLPRLKQMAYEVKGSIKAPYAISPAYPSPVVLKLGPGRRAEAQAVVTSEKPPVISDITFDAPIFAADVRPGDAPDKTIVAIVPNDTAAGQVSGLCMFTMKIGESVFRERISVRGILPSAPELSTVGGLSTTDSSQQ